MKMSLVKMQVLKSQCFKLVCRRRESRTVAGVRGWLSSADLGVVFLTRGELNITLMPAWDFQLLPRYLRYIL